jgi:hypothetical protein
MGSWPLRAELSERGFAARPLAERMYSKQTGERAGSRPQPPQAGALQRQP